MEIFKKQSKRQTDGRGQKDKKRGSSAEESQY